MSHVLSRRQRILIRHACSPPVRRAAPAAPQFCRRALQSAPRYQSCRIRGMPGSVPWLK